MNFLNIFSKAPVTFGNIDTTKKVDSGKAVHKSDDKEKMDRMISDTDEVSSKVLPNFNNHLVDDHFEKDTFIVLKSPQSQSEFVKKSLEQNAVETTELGLKSMIVPSMQKQVIIDENMYAKLMGRMDVMESDINKLTEEIVELKSCKEILELELNRFKLLGSYEDLKKLVEIKAILLTDESSVYSTPIFGYEDRYDAGAKFFRALPLVSTISGLSNIAAGACVEKAGERKTMRIIRGLFEAGIITSVLLLPIDVVATLYKKK